MNNVGYINQLHKLILACRSSKQLPALQGGSTAPTRADTVLSEVPLAAPALSVPDPVLLLRVGFALSPRVGLGVGLSALQWLDFLSALPQVNA